ncbi:IclR family transcriptional regulator domain-containing protein [Novosphingobium pentaromativorans]|nr:IclR family transcriptional regulator C-terminal domain-containing protein [Novosphingobium pentaromativorans]AIT80575.1 hypothetical protein JI59_12750 [Novosphingobium pentaromativorans US6-1]
MPSYKPVTAALRAFDVLAIVNQLPQASFARIHQETQLSSSTVVRILETLEAAGLVLKDSTTGCYVPTSRTLSLSAGYSSAQQLSVVSKPILAELQDRISWPSDLAVRDRDMMVLVQTSRAQGHLFFNRQAGYRAPILGTSLGMAYLAYQPENVVQEIVAMMAHDERLQAVLADDAAAVHEQLARVREAGFATMHPVYSAHNYDSKVSAIGVPVCVDGYAIAALNVMFLTDIVDEKAKRKLVPRLREAADSIAAGSTI